MTGGDMAEKEADSSNASPEIVRDRINELVHDYSDAELGAMLRAAALAREQEQRANLTTMESFRSWLRSVGLDWVASGTERIARFWETLKRFFS